MYASHIFQGILQYLFYFQVVEYFRPDTEYSALSTPTNIAIIDESHFQENSRFLSLFWEHMRPMKNHSSIIRQTKNQVF